VRVTRDVLAACLAGALTLVAVVTGVLVPSAAAVGHVRAAAAGSPTSGAPVARSLDVTGSHRADPGGDEVAPGTVLDRHGARSCDLDAATPAAAPPRPGARVGDLVPQTGTTLGTRGAWRATGRAPPGPADR
jgi:hypothetical protein